MPSLELSLLVVMGVGVLVAAGAWLELRRLGDLLEAINHAVERVAVGLRRR